MNRRKFLAIVLSSVFIGNNCLAQEKSNLREVFKFDKDKWIKIKMINLKKDDKFKVDDLNEEFTALQNAYYNTNGIASVLIK